MKYFFVLGNHPALSVAELYSRLPIITGSYLRPDIFLAEVKDTINGEQFLDTIGGTIKMGKIITSIENKPHAIFTTSLDFLRDYPKQGKFNFGLSSYGKLRMDTKSVGLALKQALKNEDISCRFVVSKEKTLSSVVVEQNKLISSGRELVYIGDGNEVMIGATEAVQPFKKLSERDYGRPARDDRSGMLPPKLAQMMINISGAKQYESVLDPFCGSGTVLTEALLMGYTKIFGSDISPKAIEDSRHNIRWTKDMYRLHTNPELQVIDVRQLTRNFKRDSVDAIVTETYLGPQRGVIDILKVSRELTVLYNQALQEMFLILKKGGRAVIALPAFMSNGRPKLLDLHIGKFKSVEIIPRNLDIHLGITTLNSFVYGRDDQKVWREIIILEK